MRMRATAICLILYHRQDVCRARLRELKKKIERTVGFKFLLWQWMSLKFSACISKVFTVQITPLSEEIREGN
jgi:hypothetical protein